jgi:APA family basic amino acid/polyamine antiporter
MGSDMALRRSLNLVQLVFYGAGSMIGAGIYSVIGAAAGEAGYNLWLSFLLAGFAAFLTVLSYAELASALPKAGAEYQFLKKAFPSFRLASFMAGYLIALNAAATSATVSLAFAGYLNVFFETPGFITAFLLLAVCTAVNIAGIQQSTKVSIALICIEIAGLLLIITAGFWAGEIKNTFEKPPSLADASGILSASALIFFIYIGFEDVANLSEETKNPRVTIPRALLVSVILTSIVYVLVAFSVMALSTPEALSASASPLTSAAKSVAPWMGDALAIAALFATSSTALISLISISRMLFGMAREGDMPRLLSKTHSRRKTPWVAALALFGAACLFLPLGQVKTIASISSFGVLLVFVGVHAAVIALRYSQPGLRRTFKVPVSIGKFPLIPLLGISISLALLTQFEMIIYIIGGSAVAFGAFVYLAMRKLF